LKAASAPEPSGNGENWFMQNVYGYRPRLLKKITWAVGSSLLCSQYSSV